MVVLIEIGSCADARHLVSLLPAGRARHLPGHVDPPYGGLNIYFLNLQGPLYLTISRLSQPKVSLSTSTPRKRLPEACPKVMLFRLTSLAWVPDKPHNGSNNIGFGEA